MKRILAIAMALAMLVVGGGALADVTLNVIGCGTVYMEADLATALLGVNLSGEDLESLQKEATETINSIYAALQEAGMDAKDISTNYIYISPRYDYSGVTEEIIGYNISNTLSIRTSEIDMIGAYIDAAFAAGANSFDSISFSAESDAEARKQALELAVKDAQMKAETIAAASGKTLGGMISISEGSQQDYWSINGVSGSVAYAKTEDAAAGMGSTVRAAEVMVTAKVEVTYDMT